MEKGETRYKTSLISKERLSQEGTVGLIVIFGIIIIAIILVTIQAFSLELQGIIFVSTLMVLFYLIIISFILEPKIIEEKTEKEIREEIRTMPLLKTVQIEKKVVEEKPVIQRVLHEVPKPIIHEIGPYVIKGKKLDIPRYEYLGSSETKTYHKRNCRFSKLIKRKYKVSNDDENFFIKKGYRPCEICITKKSKK